MFFLPVTTQSFYVVTLQSFSFKNSLKFEETIFINFLISAFPNSAIAPQNPLYAQSCAVQFSGTEQYVRGSNYPSNYPSQQRHFMKTTAARSSIMLHSNDQFCRDSYMH